ncbi:MAG: hypothetical protein ACI8S6_005064 [Myxococcota bacterium]|jgi:hypothetical protein
MSTVTLLGPQRLSPFVGAELSKLGVRGPVAAITAGWQEREEEDEELRIEAGVPVVNLRLYGRWDDIRRHDQDYFRAHRRRQDRLRQLRALYQRRLNHLMAQAADLLALKGPADLIEPEQVDVIRSLRQLDSHYLGRVQAVNEEFEWTWRPGERDHIARNRREVHDQIRDCEAVLISGGHIAVLINRLRLFALGPLLRRRPVIAWSAGAMAMTERIVLFHDTPPQGEGYAEVFEAGLGLVPGLIVLPDARHRLSLDDRSRVKLMAQRLSPSLCVPLDENQGLMWENGTVRCGDAVRCLRPDGSIIALRKC